MKLKTFAAALAAVTIAGSAFAADLPSRKVAPAYIAPAPIMTWSGLYLGVNAGYTWSGSNSTNITAFDTGGAGFAFAQVRGGLPTALASKHDGFIGGGQIGYNLQLGPSFVAGLEADISGVIGSRSSSSVVLQGVGVVPVGTGVSSKLDYLATLRGRLGFLVTPSLLAYATGGLALGGAESTVSVVCPTCAPPFAGTGNFSNTRVGWTVGAGAEWMFAQNWSAKLEYLYYDLGRSTVSTPVYVFGANASIVTASNRYNGHVVRAGLNYHFNWGSAAPVVAKY